MKPVLSNTLALLIKKEEGEEKEKEEKKKIHILMDPNFSFFLTFRTNLIAFPETSEIQ